MYNSGITMRKGAEVAGGSGIGLLIAELILAFGDQVAPTFFESVDIRAAITSLAIIASAVAVRMINNWLSHKDDKN